MPKKWKENLMKINSTLKITFQNKRVLLNKIVEIYENSGEICAEL